MSDIKNRRTVDLSRLVRPSPAKPAPKRQAEPERIRKLGNKKPKGGSMGATA